MVRKYSCKTQDTFLTQFQAEKSTKNSKLKIKQSFEYKVFWLIYLKTLQKIAQYNLKSLKIIIERVDWNFSIE